MPTTYALPPDTIRQLVDAAVDTILVEPEVRDLLLFGVPTSIATSIKRRSAPRLQMFGDLVAMNDDVEHIRAWIENALLVLGDRPARSLFEQVLGELKPA